MHLFQSLTPDEARFILPPLALVETIDSRPCVGFVMRRVPAAFRELAEFVMNPVLAAEQFRQGRNWADFFRAARSIANSLVVLHGKGCAHSDIHYSNFLADLSTGAAVMLEADGVVVPGFLPPQVAGMAGFMAPEILVSKQRPNERTDRHSLAVLLIHTLLFRNVMQPLIEYSSDLEQSERLGWGEKALFSEHPNDRRHRPRNVGVPLYSQGCLSYRMLPPMMQSLASRSFVEGLHHPDKRPSSREWEAALACALDELYACPRCRQHYPYPHWLAEAGRRRCPFCGAMAAEPAPLVLRLYEPKGKQGYFATERWVVLGHGFKLFADVLDPARVPPFSRRQEPAAAHVEWDAGRRQWRVVNDGAGEIRCVGEGGMQRAAKGQSVAVCAGRQLQFGPDARLALVLQ
jgi:DNA-binding helix-hairpin-helix protein with protein kinase domain